MGAVFQVAGMDASATALSYLVPNNRGLTGFFLTGGTSAKSIRNLAPNASGPGALAGTPLNFSSSPSFMTANYSQAGFTAVITATGLLQVSAMLFGTIFLGTPVTGFGAPTGCNIVSQVSGAPGGVGVYNLSAAPVSDLASAGFVSGGGLGGYITTPILDSPSLTMIFAARMNYNSDIATAAFIGGNYKGSAFQGVSIYANGPTAWRAIGGFTPSGGGAAVQETVADGLTLGVFQMIACVVDGAALTFEIFNLSTGANSGAVATGGALVSNIGVPFYIGAGPASSSPTYGGACDIAFAEFHNVALSQAELQAVYNAMQGPLANRGVTV